MLEKYKQDLELIKQGKLPKLTTTEEENTTNLHSQDVKKNMDLIKEGKLPELQRENECIWGLQYLCSSQKIKSKKAKDDEKQR